MKSLAEPFEAYQNCFENIKLERNDGILVVTFHTDGGEFVWSALSHDELGYCFEKIAADRGNKVVVITGTGENFCTEINAESFSLSDAKGWDHVLYEGRRLLTGLLSINVPVISAVNGPARIHPEIPVLSNIVLTSETALFQDAPHFMSGIVPGDGAHIVWPFLLGQTRGSYFLITGEEMSADQAKEYGVVNEVLPADKLMPRAMELARYIADKPELTRRYTRMVLTQRIKKIMEEGITLGLALEALAAIDMLPTSGRMDGVG